MFAFIDALLDAFPTKAVIAIWVDMRIGKNVKTNWTFEFLLHDIIKQLKRHSTCSTCIGCHDCLRLSVYATNSCTIATDDTLYSLRPVQFARNLLEIETRN